MKKLTAAAAAVLTASNALAMEDSGTSGVGEMSLSGGQFAMIVGALLGLGAVIWVVTKLASR